MEINIKRAYDAPAPGDGMRVLVDRLWPRGLTHEEAQIDLWAKSLSPSTALRQWFHGNPGEHDEFIQRYDAELSKQSDVVAEFWRRVGDGPVTLIHSSKDVAFNNAMVLRAYLEAQRAE